MNEPEAHLKIHLQPRAKGNRVVGWHGDALKIKLTAPPVDQKANEALVLFLAELLGVAKRSVTIVHGEKGRLKQVRITGLTTEAVGEKLKDMQGKEKGV